MFRVNYSLRIRVYLRALHRLRASRTVLYLSTHLSVPTGLMSSIAPSQNNINMEPDGSGDSLMELTTSPADSLLNSGAAEAVPGAGGDVIRSTFSPTRPATKRTRDGAGEMASGNKSDSSMADRATNEPSAVIFEPGRPLSFAGSTGFYSDRTNSVAGDTKPIKAVNGPIRRVNGPIHVFGGTTPGFQGPNAGFGRPKASFAGPNAGFNDMNAGFGGMNAGFNGMNAGFGGPNAGFNGLNAGLGGPNSQTEGVYTVAASLSLAGQSGLISAQLTVTSSNAAKLLAALHATNVPSGQSGGRGRGRRGGTGGTRARGAQKDSDTRGTAPRDRTKKSDAAGEKASSSAASPSPFA